MNDHQKAEQVIAGMSQEQDWHRCGYMRSTGQPYPELLPFEYCGRWFQLDRSDHRVFRLRCRSCQRDHPLGWRGSTHEG